MDTNEILTVRFEPCSAHAGGVDDPCDTCGWLDTEHGADHGAEPAIEPMIEVGALPLAA